MYKKRIAYFTLLFFIIVNSASGAYIVHDPKIFVQIKDQLTTGKNILKNTQEQINNQIKELTSYSSNVLKPFSNGFNQTNDLLASTKKQYHGIMNSVRSEEDAWKDTFKNLEHINLKDVSITNVYTAKKQMENEQELNHKDNLMMIKRVRLEQAEQQKRVAQLLELNKSPEGQKQSMQIANQLEAEKILAQNLENELNTLLINQETLDKQIEKTNKDNVQKHNEKVAGDFKEWKNLESLEGDSLFSELKSARKR